MAKKQLAKEGIDPYRPSFNSVQKLIKKSPKVLIGCGDEENEFSVIPEGAQVTFFGCVPILKALCPLCGSLSIVTDGMSACCRIPFSPPAHYRTKRESEGTWKRSIPKVVKIKVLNEQGGCCIYCGQRLGEYCYNEKRNKSTRLCAHFDHFICWVYSHDNEYNNILASCHICNLIKGSKLFKDFEECQQHILRRRRQKGWVDLIPVESYITEGSSHINHS